MKNVTSLVEVIVQSLSSTLWCGKWHGLLAEFWGWKSQAHSTAIPDRGLRDCSPQRETFFGLISCCISVFSMYYTHTCFYTHTHVTHTVCTS